MGLSSGESRRYIRTKCGRGAERDPLQRPSLHLCSDEPFSSKCKIIAYVVHGRVLSVSRTICTHHAHYSEHARFHVLQYFKLSITVSYRCVLGIVSTCTVHSHTAAGISTGTVLHYIHIVHLLQQLDRGLRVRGKTTHSNLST